MLIAQCLPFSTSEIKLVPTLKKLSTAVAHRATYFFDVRLARLLWRGAILKKMPCNPLEGFSEGKDLWIGYCAIHFLWPPDRELIEVLLNEVSCMKP
jgi:hypothetical protein